MHINTWNTTYRLGWGKMLLRDVANEAVRLQMENLGEKKNPIERHTPTLILTTQSNPS